MRILSSFGIACLALSVCVRGANAQTTTWTDHARVSINFGVQPSAITFSGSTTKPVNLETATINTTYGVSNGQLFDGGILVRVARGFGVGVAVSSVSKRQDATVAGMIPHPFLSSSDDPPPAAAITSAGSCCGRRGIA